MKLSIIIPLYNKEKYIERCLKCLYKQGLENDTFEIIIVDDGSTDASFSIVRNFAIQHSLSNIKLIKQDNQGPSAARNNGLTQAIGEYLYFFDADDLLANNALNILVRLCKKNGLDILEFDSKEIEEEKLFKFPDSVDYNQNDFNISIYNANSFITKYNFRNQAWRYLIKRNYLLESNITFLEDMRAYEDLIFTASVFLQSNKISKVNIDAHRYIKVANSIVTTKNPKKNLEFILGMVKAVEEIDLLIEKYSALSEKNQSVLQKLKAKQHVVVYALVVRAFKYRLEVNTLSTILTKLKTLNAYPVGIKSGNSGFKSVLNAVLLPFINNKASLLLGLQIIRKF